jgi:hypothetical protein
MSVQRRTSFMTLPARPPERHERPLGEQRTK